MLNRIEYIIVENKSLVLESYVGKLNIDEFIEFKIKVGNDQTYDPNFNVIHDFRKVEFLLEMDEIPKYVAFISKTKKLLGNRKSAMITKTPNQVVITTGFDMLINELPIQVKVCSTPETAFNFVDLPKKDWNVIKSLLDSLKK